MSDITKASDLLPIIPKNSETELRSNFKGKLKYSHTALIDALIANPMIDKKELAETFGVSYSWICTATNSDAFLTLLEKRRREIADPILIETLTDRMRALTNGVIDLIEQRVGKGAVKNTELIDIMKVGLMSQGLLRDNEAPVVNNSFVVALPNKAENADSWMKSVNASQEIKDNTTHNTIVINPNA